MLKTTTAKTLFKYEDEFFEDLAAVTLNEYEGGKVYYIGSGADNTIMAVSYTHLKGKCSIHYGKPYITSRN